MLFSVLSRTVLPALAILCIGVLLLLGIQSALPDYTEELHSYDLPAVSEPTKFDPFSLYPWELLTESVDQPSEFVELEWLSLMLTESFDMIPAEFDFSGAELSVDPSKTVFGVENVSVFVENRVETEVLTDAQSVTGVSQYRLSFAFDLSDDAPALCFLLLENVSQTSDGQALTEGFGLLCEYAEHASDGTPFSDFFTRCSEACDKLGLTCPPTSALQNGAVSSVLCDSTAVFTFPADRSALTVLCDPISLSVVGFSRMA